MGLSFLLMECHIPNVLHSLRRLTIQNLCYRFHPILVPIGRERFIARYKLFLGVGCCWVRVIRVIQETTQTKQKYFADFCLLSLGRKERRKMRRSHFVPRLRSLLCTPSSRFELWNLPEHRATQCCAGSLQMLPERPRARGGAHRDERPPVGDLLQTTTPPRHMSPKRQISSRPQRHRRYRRARPSFHQENCR